MKMDRIDVFIPYHRIMAYARLQPPKLSWPELCVYCCKPAVGCREFKVTRTIAGSYKQHLVESYSVKAHFCSDHLILDGKYTNLLKKAWGLAVVWGIPVAIISLYLVGQYNFMDLNFLEKAGFIIGVVAINQGIWVALIGPTMRQFSRLLSDEYRLFKDYYWNALGLSAKMNAEGIRLGFANPTYAEKFIDENRLARITETG